MRSSIKKIVVFIFLTFFISAGGFAEIEKKELIFPSGTLNSSHAPSIAVLPNGDLFTVWYAPTSESPNAVIWSSRKPAGLDKWTEPTIVQQNPGLSDKNPVLYVGDNNRLWLFWAQEKRFYKWPIDTLCGKVSEDSGYTWSRVRKLDTPIGVIPRTHPIKLRTGRVLFPLYVSWNTSSAMLASEDDGYTWGKLRYMLYFFGIQPTIIQRTDSSLFALTRCGMWPRLAWQTVSYNDGRNWKEQVPSNINNPGSSLEMIKLKSGNVVLAFNDSKKDRTNLSLALSYDDGRTWSHVKVVENDPGHFNCYPSLAQDKNGLIHLVYSYDNRQNIAHFVTDEKSLAGL